MSTAYKAALQALIEEYKDDFKDGFKGAKLRLGKDGIDSYMRNAHEALTSLCSLAEIDISLVPLGKSFEELQGYYQRVVEFLKEGGHI